MTGTRGTETLAEKIKDAINNDDAKLWREQFVAEQTATENGVLVEWIQEWVAKVRLLCTQTFMTVTKMEDRLV